jgi:hypothetical protein
MFQISCVAGIKKERDLGITLPQTCLLYHFRLVNGRKNINVVCFVITNFLLKEYFDGFD